MTSKTNDISIHDLLLWKQDKTINPQTNRKIKIDGLKYKEYERKYNNTFENGYDYLDGNDKDPVSLEPIWIQENKVKKLVYLNYNNLIMFKEDNNVFTFEKETIEYFKLHKIKKNPITTRDLPDYIFDQVGIKEESKKTVSEYALTVFQIFTNISIFVDSSDFLNLNANALHKLYYETYEFFENNIPEQHIKSIRLNSQKNNKNAFDINPGDFEELPFEKKQFYILSSFEQLLNYDDEGIKYMANYIIIGGLGLVIPKIRELYPDFSFTFSV